MASVYILYSKKLSRFYIGSCKDLQERLQQHKEKSFPCAFTSKADDWELFFEFSDLNFKQARAAEKYIKSRKSTIFIRSLKITQRHLIKSKLRISNMVV
jgi:putative endonuclease